MVSDAMMDPQHVAAPLVAGNTFQILVGAQMAVVVAAVGWRGEDVFGLVRSFKIRLYILRSLFSQ